MLPPKHPSAEAFMLIQVCLCVLDRVAWRSGFSYQNMMIFVLMMEVGRD
jgi:hypothetical protein